MNMQITRPPVPVGRAIAIHMERKCTWRQVRDILFQETGHSWPHQTIWKAVSCFRAGRPLHTTPWDDVKIDKLKAMVEDGWSPRRIAQDLAVTRNAVIGKMARLGLRGSKPTSNTKRASKTVAKLKAQPVRKYRDELGRLHTVPQPPVFAITPPPLTRAQKEYILGTGVPFMKLKPHQCKWPLNEPARGEPYFFCGERQVDSSNPYCAHHAMLACARTAASVIDAAVGHLKNSPRNWP